MCRLNTTTPESSTMFAWLQRGLGNSLHLATRSGICGLQRLRREQPSEFSYTWSFSLIMQFNKKPTDRTFERNQ
jgi:hypothetical protein